MSRLLVGVVALGLALLAYLTLADLGRHRVLIENALSRALGYELSIDELHLDLALRGASTLEARGVMVTNPSAHEDSTLLEIDHLSLRADLWPLLHRTVHIRDLELDGARLTFAAGEGGASNWSRPRTRGEPAVPRGERRVPTITVDRAVGRDLSATLRSPSLPAPLKLEASESEFATEPSGTLRVHLAGDLGNRPLAIRGTVGPIAELLIARAVRVDLAVALGDAHGTLRGGFADLMTSQDVDLELDAAGPSIDEITGLVDLPSLGSGGFRLAAHVRPEGDGSRIALRGTLGPVDATVDGTLDAPLHPRRIDATVSGSGPSLAAAGALVGFRHLPDEPFEIAGRVAWAGFPVALDGITVVVGTNRLGIDGAVGGPPSLYGTDLRLEGEGRDAAAIGSLLGVALPSSPYMVSARIHRRGHGTDVDRLSVELGGARLEAAGTIGAPPGFDGTELSVRASGPSLEPFGTLAGSELPDEPFDLVARVRPEHRQLVVEQAELRLGSASAHVTGRITPAAGLVGSTLHVQARGDDLSRLAWAARGVELPASAFSLAANLEIERDALAVSGLTASAAGIEASVEGRVGLEPMGEGTGVTIDVTGPDASVPTALAGLVGVPPLPFSISGAVRIAGGMVELDSLAARLGELQLTVSGSASVTGGLDGASGELSGTGTRVSDLVAFGAPVGLPDAPFTVSGGFRVEGEGVRIGHASGTLGNGHRIDLEGLVVPRADLAGSEVKVSVDGPDLHDLGRLLAGVIEAPALPDEPYTLTADVAVDGTGFDLRAVRATLGPAVAAVSGRLGRWPGLAGTDLTLDVDGPNASLLTAVAGITAPAAPVELSGRFVRDAEGFRFDAVSLGIGEYRARVEGRLGEPPRLIGSALEVTAEGPDLELFRELLGTGPLPALPFRVSVRASGSPLRFRLDDLDVRYGSSDVRGFARLAFEDRPQLEVRLASDRIDLGQMLRDRDRVVQASVVQESQEPDGPGGAEPPAAKVFSDEPFELEALDRLEVDAEWRIGALQLLATRLHQASLTASLHHGRLEIGPFDLTNEQGGRLLGQIVVEPDPKGHALDAHLDLKEAQVNLVRSPDLVTGRPTSLTTLIDLTAAGASPHELAAGSNGRLILSLAGGEVDSSIADILGADILMSILKALNPFRDEGSPTVGLECAVILGELENGMLVVEPMAIKSENLTILGDGTVNFDSEKLEFEWVTKPRKGLGISASTITNRSVKLGGTLAHPVIGVKGLEAVTATGVAVATGGLSLLGRGFLDRLTSSKKVCQKALKEADRRLAGEKPRHRSLLFQ